MRRSALLALLLALAAFAAGGPAVEADDRAPVAVTLNGLQVSLDPVTGGLLRLAYEGPGTLLEAAPGEAGLLDLAYPRPDFEPLRLATRYCRQAEIAHSGSSVVISWPRLGASRDFPEEDAVAASVRLDATADGRSVVMSCEVRNDSARPVRQVLFPDLAGLLPTAGVARTILKTGGFGSAPFAELQPSDSDAFYAQDNTWREYKSGGMFSDMWMRWFDLGGLSGGVSLFPRLWGWDEHSSLLVHLSPTTGKLRLMACHPVTIEPGSSWKSEEWVLTPHRGGWAKGIEPYREWARAHIQRVAPVPERVRRGLGFRSAWMCRNQPADGERDVVWHFRDLPEMAREAKEHGLDEMMLWSTHQGFALPNPPPLAHLGTEADLAQAVAECRRLGVNVAPFISVLQANKATGPRYGLTVPETGGWTYHTEMIPRFNPPYAGGYACAQVDVSNPQWQADVLEFTRHLADLGMASLGWDQFWAQEKEPNIATLAAQIRQYARSVDPESSFAGEELWNIEVDCNTLDYTWNWGGYRDCQAYTSVFPAPRHNININRSVWEAKRGFLDGQYLNVWPAKRDSINGSEWISNVPELSAALKACAALKTQFVEYFTEGTFVGDCMLTRECLGNHVVGRVLPGRLLVLLTKENGPGDINLAYDLPLWLQPSAAGYEARLYDAGGTLTGTQVVPAVGDLTVAAMDSLETRAVEFIRL